MEPAILSQSGDYGRMFTRGLVVTDHADIKIWQDGLIYLEQELLELNYAMRTANRGGHCFGMTPVSLRYKDNEPLSRALNPKILTR